MDRPAFKLATLSGVREYAEGWDVELWRTRAGRLIVRSYNEGHNAYTDVDLLDLLAGLSSAKGDGVLSEGVATANAA